MAASGKNTEFDRTQPSWYNTHMSKRQYDRLDMEAEREGSAVKRQITQQISNTRLGKGIQKQRNMHSAAINKIESRLLRKYLV